MCTPLAYASRHFSHMLPNCRNQFVAAIIATFLPRSGEWHKQERNPLLHITNGASCSEHPMRFLERMRDKSNKRTEDLRSSMKSPSWQCKVKAQWWESPGLKIYLYNIYTPVLAYGNIRENMISVETKSWMLFLELYSPWFCWHATNMHLRLVWLVQKSVIGGRLRHMYKSMVDMPNGVQGELVAAGWRTLLTAMAEEVVHGWQSPEPKVVHGWQPPAARLCWVTWCTFF